MSPTYPRSNLPPCSLPIDTMSTANAPIAPPCSMPSLRQGQGLPHSSVLSVLSVQHSLFFSFLAARIDPATARDNDIDNVARYPPDTSAYAPRAGRTHTHSHTTRHRRGDVQRRQTGPPARADTIDLRRTTPVDPPGSRGTTRWPALSRSANRPRGPPSNCPGGMRPNEHQR